MANSRLYIYDAETNTAVMLAKTMGSGWVTREEGLMEMLNTFFFGLESNRGHGTPDKTGLKIVTEYELPNDAEIIYGAERKPLPAAKVDDSMVHCSHRHRAGCPAEKTKCFHRTPHKPRGRCDKVPPQRFCIFRAGGPAVRVKCIAVNKKPEDGDAIGDDM